MSSLRDFDDPANDPERRKPPLVQDWKRTEVDHPPHYTNRSMEAIDIIEMIIEIEKNPKVAYNMSNVLKYLLRFRDKGNAIKDLRKAEWYLNRMIQHVEEE